ncbi:MAG: cysteine--tRNA ligase [Gammaproteobacteria bacterium]|nr:cysteine--tRNA ligase [Gammaproteobacteria bacterium]
MRIHNSLTGRKEELRPLEPGHVRMYVCGDTVYDFCHIGHARSKIAFDVVRRYLVWRGFRVTYVRNITDIDDKIIRRAAEAGEPIEVLTARYIDAMHEDYDRLGILRPDHEPRATEYLPAIVEMVSRLIEGGYAYVATNGDVMYAVSSFPGYGRLSGKRLADLRAGARVEIDEAKRDPLDFVLWKTSKPGEPAWDSPWGPGRPGWHIECSAMATALLGAHFDLHGGGMDLKFPHHENEIAQSCAATGEAFVECWMHNGFVNVDSEKMSKSLGNFFTIRDVLARLRDPEVLRYFFLSSHYRGPISYSPGQLGQADAALGRLYTALRDLPLPATDEAAPQGAATERFQAVMDDDFNTPEAVATLQGLAREVNSARARGDMAAAAAAGAELRLLGRVLGLLQREPEAWFRAGVPGAISDARIAELIEARAAARKAKNWAQSDRVRDELAQAGVILEDKPGGQTVWRRA